MNGSVQPGPELLLGGPRAGSEVGITIPCPQQVGAFPCIARGATDLTLATQALETLELRAGATGKMQSWTKGRETEGILFVKSAKF